MVAIRAYKPPQNRFKTAPKEASVKDVKLCCLGGERKSPMRIGYPS